jgi:hypothetical protein
LLTFGQGWPWTAILLISSCWVAGITSMSHCVQPYIFDDAYNINASLPIFSILVRNGHQDRKSLLTGLLQCTLVKAHFLLILLCDLCCLVVLKMMVVSLYLT